MSLTVIAVAVLIALSIGLGLVVRLRTQRVAIWSGAAIGVVSLVASILVSLADKSGYAPAQLTFLVNVYLVSAAIGANIFASAICLGLTPSNPLSLSRKHSESV